MAVDSRMGTVDEDSRIRLVIDRNFTPSKQRRIVSRRDGARPLFSSSIRQREIRQIAQFPNRPASASIGDP